MGTAARNWLAGVFRSLAARVGFFVFAATLTSALAVAWTSAYALRAFLRAKVEQKLPSELVQLRDRLDVWYARRALDAQVFARSAVVVDGLSRVARGGDAHGRDEVEQYLTYVLRGLPQYDSIFVLDRQGRSVLGVGHPPELDPAALRRLAAVTDVEISDPIFDRAAGPVQALSSVVRGRDEKPLFTLHAILPLGVLEAELAGEDNAARTIVFDEAGRRVAASAAVGKQIQMIGRSLRDAPTGELRDYVADDGLRVVGSALAFPRLRWTLVLEESYETAFAPIGTILGRTVALNLGIVLALSAIAFAVVTAIVRPIHALSDCARRLRDGEENVALPIVASSDEVGILARTFAEMVHSLKRANEVLEQLAITDGLTKIHNHRFFQDQLSREVKRCDRSGSPLSLVLVDIDDFKALNDQWGHAIGDSVLVQLAALLVEQTRDQDLVARYGGEEFAILAPDTDRNGALVLAEKIRLAVAATRFPFGSASFQITVSVGIASYHGDREAFFHEADRALYSAKGSGKDCVVAAAAPS